MRTSMIVAAALGSLLVSGSAFASTASNVKPPHQGGEGTDSQDFGVIAAIHAKKDTITLTDGKTFHLPGILSAKDYKKGESVQVSFTADASGNVVSVTGVKAL
jgi:Protein of unknown function (DUF1344)